MTLRDRLAAKTRRRCVVPVPVTDPGPARAQLERALTALAAASGMHELEGAVDALQADVEAAQEAVDACTVDVLLQAPPAVEAERLLSAYLDDEGIPDYAACLPELLAACCVDETLQDADWWRDTLAGEVWGRSEVAGLRLGVLYLVADPVRPLVPKD